MDLKDIVSEAHYNAREKGFWDDRITMWVADNTYNPYYSGIITVIENAMIGNRLMLIVSELGEAQEALRHGDMANFREELADVLIRLADLCGGLNIDLEDEVQKKMEKNKARPYKHGKAF
jgi:chitinase